VGATGATLLTVLPPIAAQIMFLSPLDAMRKIKQNKTTGAITAVPYTSMVISGVIWTTYGLLVSNPSLYLTNFSAIFFGSYYVYTFNKYLDPSASMKPHFAAIIAGIAGVIGTVSILPVETSVNVLGIVGDILVVIMFGGPLAVIKTVIATKSTAALPFGFTAASFVNCFLWTLYGTLVIHDPYIWIPNGLGFLAASIQMALFGIYGKSK